MIFSDKPEDFNSVMEIVGCFVEHDGKFVLLHRHAHKSSGDRLGLPAGKVEKGEELAEAMVRELWEETGIKINEDQLKYFESKYVRAKDYDLMFHMFSLPMESKPEIKINDYEHKNFIWVSPGEAVEMELIHDLPECIKLFYKI